MGGVTGIAEFSAHFRAFFNVRDFKSISKTTTCLLMFGGKVYALSDGARHMQQYDAATSTTSFAATFFTKWKPGMLCQMSSSARHKLSPREGGTDPFVPAT